MKDTKSPILMPKSQEILQQLGNNIKLARLRRNFPAELIAERAGISRATLWAIEKGSPNVAMGHYVNALHALGGMEKDLLLVAKDDVFGRMLQDANMKAPKRARRKI
ncbi:MAG: transcriptional regulator [Bacilli bacterium]|nr:transcriptional regulator [Bacilli bacterium]